MAWCSNSERLRSLAGMLGVVCAAAILGGCMFTEDAMVAVVQNPVPSIEVDIGVGATPGAAFGPAPTLAMLYQCYYDNTPSHVVPVQELDTFPAAAHYNFNGPLPASVVNCGFDRGNSDNILAVIFPAVFDDVNMDTVKEDNEQWIGATSERIIVYFQGTMTTAIADQFGQLEQGYNVLSKVGEVNGVDFYRAVGGADAKIVVLIAKSPADVHFPKLH